jgi:hypothetical protein
MVEEQMKAISEGSRENVKVSSGRLSCKSSTALQLFKESTALLQTITSQKCVFLSSQNFI